MTAWAGAHDMGGGVYVRGCSSYFMSTRYSRTGTLYRFKQETYTHRRFRACTALPTTNLY
jgi:hypothetical protein